MTWSSYPVRPAAGGRAGHDEAGADVAHRFRKPLTDEVIQAADNAIAIGCRALEPPSRTAD